mmetsp:Transcript_39869/g.87020  ORF Transcript_39869/g.87020 Transcript_39869/m.87020 type:complete len:99 (-) Transcript_39869:607-903(-)
MTTVFSRPGPYAHHVTKGLTSLIALVAPGLPRGASPARALENVSGNGLKGSRQAEPENSVVQPCWYWCHCMCTNQHIRASAAIMASAVSNITQSFELQ